MTTIKSQRPWSLAGECEPGESSLHSSLHSPGRLRMQETKLATEEIASSGKPFRSEVIRLMKMTERHVPIKVH